MHSRAFAEATVSERGERALNRAAQLMALTAMDVLLDKKLREEIHREFKARIENVRGGSVPK